MIVYITKVVLVRQHPSLPCVRGGVKNLRFLTDEECGRKSNGYLSVSGFYKPTDFAIPHPSALTGCHLPPGGRYNGCGCIRKINDHFYSDPPNKKGKHLLFRRCFISVFPFAIWVLSAG